MTALRPTAVVRGGRLFTQFRPYRSLDGESKRLYRFDALRERRPFRTSSCLDEVLRRVEAGARYRNKKGATPLDATP